MCILFLYLFLCNIGNFVLLDIFYDGVFFREVYIVYYYFISIDFVVSISYMFEVLVFYRVWELFGKYLWSE